jgi:hypothetical protein
MLVFTANDGDHNIVQLVIGPQTRFQLDITGVIRIDLGKILENFDNDLPLKMVVTSAECEQRTAQMLAATNGAPPFPPAFFKSAAEVARITEERMQQAEDDAVVVEETDSQDFYHEDPRGQYVDEIQCPGCKTLGVFLKKNMPPYCADCLKIELGLGNIDDSVDEIEVEAEIPEQRTGPRKLTGRKKTSE